ncbi:MAG: gliding motility-associated C-terminal domain-containing protein [Microscillaceae bacterium]|nr:gliding motility-associated C-terminal domain-containing protein [Microscillaceae bacterium]
MGKDTLSCENDFLNLDVSQPDATYEWQDGSTNPQYIISETGLYWVEVSIGDCKKRDSILVEVLKIELGEPKLLCKNEPFELNAFFVGASYRWQDGSTNPSFTVTQPGKYWVEVRKKHCITSDTVLIDFTDPPVVNLGKDTLLCVRQSLVLNVNQPEASFRWQDGSSNPQFTVNQAGMYWVEVSKGDCRRIDSIKVEILEIDLGNDQSLCQNEPLELNAFFEGATYRWQDGSTAPTFEVNQSGKYWVEIKKKHCIFRDSIDIQFVILPILHLGNDTLLCANDILELNASQPNVSYRWQDGSTQSKFQVSESGVYWVELTKDNCKISDTIRVEKLKIDLGADRTVCNTQTVVLDATFMGATYRWQDGSTAPTFTVNQSGKYWVEVRKKHCVFRDTVDIQLVSPPIVNLGQDTILCVNESLVLNVFQNGATYRWQDGSSNPNYAIQNGGLYWVEVSKGDCKVRDSIRVDKLTLELGNERFLCQNEQLTFNVFQNGATYRWQDGSVSFLYTISQPGKYWVEIKKGRCSITDTLVVNYSIPPNLNLGRDTVLCVGEKLQFNVSQSEASYRWQDNTTSANYEITQSGVYWVQVTRGGCVRRDSLRVNFVDLNFDLGANFRGCFRENYTLAIPEIPQVKYRWSNGAITARISVNKSGKYWVEAQIGNCIRRDSIELQLIDCDIFNPDEDFWIPNIFTPDNRGKNETFFVNGIVTKGWLMKIYNRLGDLVYQNPDYQNDWRAEKVANDMYYYELTHPRHDRVYKGWVQVMR